MGKHWVLPGLVLPGLASAWVSALVGLTVGCSGCGAQPGPRLQVPALDEPSGLAASARHPGRLYTHNDSGDGPRLFAIDAEGRGHGEFAVAGAAAVDWECIAADGQGHLWIGDTGNNGSGRRDLRLYRVPEPAALGADGRLTVDRTIAFRYAEQKHVPDKKRRFDAEALFVAPRPDTGAPALYLLTKHRKDTQTVLYRFDLDTPPGASAAGAAAAGGSVEVEPAAVGAWDVGGADRPHGGRVTSADATPDGRWLAVLTYHALLVFERPARGAPEGLGRLHATIDFDQDATGQIEAVAWQGDGVVMLNEAGRIFQLADPRAGWVGRFPSGQPGVQPAR